MLCIRYYMHAIHATTSSYTAPLPLSSRRIHISRATLDCLDGVYQTELGHGADRSEFLRKHKIDTFLVCPKENGTPLVQTERTKTVKANRTWNLELPFGNITDMNCVGSRQDVMQIGKNHTSC